MIAVVNNCISMRRKVFSDRAQNTLMMNTLNPDSTDTSVVALLTDAAPTGVTPPPKLEVNQGRTFRVKRRDHLRRRPFRV